MWYILSAICFLTEHYLLVIVFIIIGMFNTEEDKHYEEQVIELTEERKFFTEDFNEQKIFNIYNDKGWWGNKSADELEDYVGSEVEDLEMRLKEYWEIPASNAISNNLWLVPENESFSYAVRSHEFILERLKFEFYLEEYKQYFKYARKIRNGFFWKTDYAAYNISYNFFRYNAMFAFYYLSPQEHTYALRKTRTTLKHREKKFLSEYKIESFFYDDGGLLLERRKDLKLLASNELVDKITI